MIPRPTFTKGSRPPGTRFRVLPLVFLLTIVGCDDREEADPSGPETAPVAVERADRPNDWNPRMELLRETAQDDLGWEPESTEWAATDPPPSLGQVVTDPFHALLAVASELAGWDEPRVEGLREITVRTAAEGNGRVLGFVLDWGYLDDSVAGRDLRIRFEPAREGWETTRTEERHHCRRGITDDGLCL